MYVVSAYTDRGQLVAVGVIDILPHCVSSVYLFYDPAFAHWELGKISALNEIALARRLRREGHTKLRWYYLGTWSCDSPRFLHPRLPKDAL